MEMEIELMEIHFRKEIGSFEDEIFIGSDEVLRSFLYNKGYKEYNTHYLLTINDLMEAQEIYKVDDKEFIKERKDILNKAIAYMMNGRSLYYIYF